MTDPQMQKQKSVWFRGTVIIHGERYIFKSFTRSSTPTISNIYFQVEMDNVIKDEVLDRMLV
eukprot:snap_masked-scaffold_53-processed-gene-1.91-mRNA-1 protein AED:0.43 eAED:1.00 QI:0/0/0/1/1/1/2/0/61